MRAPLLFVVGAFLLACSSPTQPPDPIDTTPSIPIGQIESLTPGEAFFLIEKLPPFAELAETSSIKLRDRSLPAPQAGDIKQLSFLPEESSTAPTSAPSELAVLRVTPEGEVPFAKSLSIVFNQAMVPLGSSAALSFVPVSMTPSVNGEWRWVGDKMLTFEANEKRLPMSTDFTIEVPTSLSSVSGKSLVEKKSVSFSTPTPKLIRTYPTQGQEVDTSPVLILVFNQRIDANKVTSALQVKVGAQNIPTKTAVLADLIREEVLSQVASLPEKTFVALLLEKELPKNAKVEVTLPAGAYSDEGPRVSAKAESFSFVTYEPLQAEFFCNYTTTKDPCENDSWHVEFSNSLSEDVSEDSFVLTPSIENQRVEIYGSSVYFYGRFLPDTAYQIKVPGSINDEFGQSLGAEKTFTGKTSSAPKSISGPSRDVVTLSPHQKPELTFYSSGYSSLKVKMYRVSPKDFTKIEEITPQEHPNEEAPEIPGELLSESSIAVNVAEKDPKTIIDLTPALQDGVGHVLVAVVPEAPIVEEEIPPLFYRWVNVTNLGVDLFVDGDRLLVFASSLVDGKRLPGVEVVLYPGQQKVTTNESGFAFLSLPALSAPKDDNKFPDTVFVTATKGKDSILLRPDGWSQLAQDPDTKKDSLLWYVTDDRRLYKPGETASLKGIIRRQPPGERRDTLYLGDSIKEVQYKLQDSRGNKIEEGKVALSNTGSFSLQVKLPKEMNLGAASLSLWIEGDFLDKEYRHSLRVEEYRRPEFEVLARSAEGPFFLGGTAESTVTATYYTGGGLPEAPVVWRLSANKTSYTPPNNEEFSFGDSEWSSPDVPAVAPQSIEGFTDALGKHTATFDLKTIYDPESPMYFSADASVTDINQQRWSAYTGFTVHNGKLYAGLRSATENPLPNSKLLIEAVVSDIDGKRVANQELTITAKRTTWGYKRQSWIEEEVAVGDCKLRTAVSAQSCPFQITEGGTYIFSTVVTDDAGKKNKTSMTVYVPGLADPRETPELTIEPAEENKEYKPGDIAKFFVKSPFPNVEGVILLGNGTIVRVLPMRFEKVFGTVEIPVEEWMLPRVTVDIFSVGFIQNKKTDGSMYPKKPIYAKASTTLHVSVKERLLSVSAQTVKKVLTPSGATWKTIKALPPGGKAEIEVTVKDFNNKPVKNAEVSIIVVDEAVLDIASFSHPSPEWAMYSTWGGYYGGYSSIHSRDNFLDEEELITRNAIMPGEGFGFGGRGMGGGGSGSGIGRGAGGGVGGSDEGEFETRKNLDPLALFAMDVKTNAKGVVRVPLKLPDSLTRYRIFAIAATEKSFGAGRSSITAKIPLMVRPSLPRFLRDGDVAMIPVIVQNLSDKAVVTEVILRGQNVTVRENGYRMHIPANDRLRVFFTVETQRPGLARFQVAAKSANAKDAVELSIPVYTPGTIEDNAIYGQLDDGVLSQSLLLPPDASDEYGGFTLQTSTTAVSSLTDAMLYLNNYPYECSEQLSSRMMGYLALQDVLSAFAADGIPTQEDLNIKLKKDIETLTSRQTSEGGFGFWSKDDLSWPYVSIHVAHALVRAKERGLIKGDEPLYSKSLAYVKNVETYLTNRRASPQTKSSLLVYALYVRKMAGEPDESRAKRLLQEQKDALSLESLGRLLFVLSSDTASVELIKPMLFARVIETANEARFANSMTEEDRHILLSSAHRTDAIILDGLLAATPSDPIIPKVVTSLLSRRKAGRWSSTQENVFVLLALEKYFKTFESQTPDFAVKSWAGEFYLGSQEHRGRSTEKQKLFIAMSDLAGLGSPRITLSKEGAGRLYYRMGLTYSPKETKIEAKDLGFMVERTFESVKDASDVERLSDGTWKIKSGATVRVRLKISSSAQRSHVALVDQLPGGLEVQNMSLAMVPSESQADRWDWWRRTWYEHQNLRDDRVEVFASELNPGAYEYTYVVRATTPGTFLVPPVKAEEMYSPEVFGRGKSDVVVIDAPSEQL